jgi:hypothetical protein
VIEKFVRMQAELIQREQLHITPVNVLAASRVVLLYFVRALGSMPG